MKLAAVKILSSLLLLFLLCGCAEVPGNTPDTSPPGGDVPVSETPASPPTAQSPQPSSLSWPQDKMGDLPDPGFTLLSVTDVGSGTNVSVEGMTPDDAAAYIQSVKDLEYATQAEGEDGQGGLIYSGTKDGRMVMILYNIDSLAAGGGLFQISYE